MDIAIDRQPRDTGIELRVCGRLDAESAGELRLAVREEVHRGGHEISLDLACVTFLSSAGIRVLFETQREARRAGGDCIVIAVSDPVRKVLELTRLDSILMQRVTVAGARPASVSPSARDLESHGVRLLGIEAGCRSPLRMQVFGSAAALTDALSAGERLKLRPTTFAIGLAAMAGESATRQSAGESLAACGSLYHRPPRPFAMVDYVHGTGDLVPEIDVVAGIAWEGIPEGRGFFEPAADAPSVGIDDLAAALLEAAGPGPLAFVLVGEVHGLVAAELIRPLAEATATDHPLVGTRDGAARWLCFSREPIHAGRTAMVVGIVSRAVAGSVAGMLGPLGVNGVSGHLHAAIFPHRTMNRVAADLSKLVNDLAASEPLAVVHLMADDRPVIGSGVSHFVRGALWFGPAVLSARQE